MHNVLADLFPHLGQRQHLKVYAQSQSSQMLVYPWDIVPSLAPAPAHV